MLCLNAENRFLIICSRRRKYDQTDQHFTIKEYEITRIRSTRMEIFMGIYTDDI